MRPWLCATWRVFYLLGFSVLPIRVKGLGFTCCGGVVLSTGMGGDPAD